MTMRSSRVVSRRISSVVFWIFIHSVLVLQEPDREHRSPFPTQSATTVDPSITRRTSMIRMSRGRLANSNPPRDPRTLRTKPAVFSLLKSCTR